MQRKTEIKELSQQKDEWAGKLALAKAALDKVEEQLETLTKDYEEAQKRSTEQEIRLAECKKDLERAETELRNADQAQTKQRQAVEQLQLKQQTTQQSRQETESSFLEFKSRRETLDEEIAELSTEVDNRS